MLRRSGFDESFCNFVYRSHLRNVNSFQEKLVPSLCLVGMKKYTVVAVYLSAAS